MLRLPTDRFIQLRRGRGERQRLECKHELHNYLLVGFNTDPELCLQFMENMKDTAWDFALVLRQKYQEEIFRNAMKKVGVTVEAPVELKAIDVDPGKPRGSHRITATVQDSTTLLESTVACRYLIGCDEGHSSVRRW